MTDNLQPFTGGTVHNLSDKHCRVRVYGAPDRDGAVCAACSKAGTYGMSDAQALAFVRAGR